MMQQSPPPPPPVAQHQRRIPFHLCQKVANKIARLEHNDIIIEKRTESTPTEWVSRVVIVPKQNKNIRLYADMPPTVGVHLLTYELMGPKCRQNNPLSDRPYSERRHEPACPQGIVRTFYWVKYCSACECLMPCRITLIHLRPSYRRFHAWVEKIPQLFPFSPRKIDVSVHSLSENHHDNVLNILC